MMQKYAFIGVMLFSNYSFSQKVKIEVKNPSVTVRENVTVKFTFNAYADSLKYPDYPSFYLIEIPVVSDNTSIRDGKTTSSKEITFTLKPRKTGSYSLPSPTFYVGKKAYHDFYNVEVTGPDLTPEERKKLEVDYFVGYDHKRNGTIKLMCDTALGYSQIWKDGKFVEYKYLTKEEISAIRNILKIQ